MEIDDIRKLWNLMSQVLDERQRRLFLAQRLRMSMDMVEQQLCTT
jgi:hypothetical protein